MFPLFSLIVAFFLLILFFSVSFLDSLDLPDLEKKRLKSIIGEKTKRKGHRSQGIRPRLSKKETLKNKIRRKKATIRENKGNIDPDVSIIKNITAFVFSLGVF